MKFDTAIIGGGLSGLVCGIRLVREGQQCVIISSGQSSLHFSSGSFDLLSYLPNGEKVTNPQFAIEQLSQLSPKHPYAKLGNEKFNRLTQEAAQLFAEAKIPVHGRANENHYRVTPMGTLKPTWLTITDFMRSQYSDSLPWKKIAIFNVIGFLDFHPQFIADEFSKLGIECTIKTFSLPEIDNLRRNPSEMRSTNIARAVDKEKSIQELIHILKVDSEDYEAIVLPACVGLKNNQILKQIEDAIGKPVCLIPTLPPSIVGIRTQQRLRDYFIQLGGVYMLGDTVQKAEIENNRITKIYSYNHRDIPFIAQNFVLATGSYFSQGLIATSDRIYEPVFDLDVEYATNRTDWYNKNMFENQAYQEFGVKTNQTFNASVNNEIIDNLYAAGAILEGFNPVKEGSGSGVSILSALSIAESILSKK